MLTVAHFFDPTISDKDVLRAVRPRVNSGTDQYQLIDALQQLGMGVDYRQDMTLGKLRKYVERGVPVIVSVWPDDYPSDHWVVVQGFDDEKGRIYLANHYSLSVEQFRAERSNSDMRKQGKSKEGFVCSCDE